MSGFPDRRPSLRRSSSCGGAESRTSVAVTLLTGCAYVSFLLQGVVGDVLPGGAQPGGECSQSSDGISCTCSSAGGGGGRDVSAGELQATLSESSPKLSLTCTGDDVTAVPATMTDGNVCPKEAALEDCGGGSKQRGSAPVVKLDSLLSTPGVTWKDGSTGAAKKYSLDIPPGAFPRLDKDFSVGCKTSSKAICKVSVVLTARTSGIEGKTVTCAYGSASNNNRQSVTLTPSNNQLTISCGVEGTIVPAEYTTKSCAHGAELTPPDGCAGKMQAFADLFPGFDQSWWVKQDVRQATLKIPAAKFPVDDQKFTLGCKSTAESGRASSPPGQPTICTVDVIVEKQLPTTTTTPAASSATNSLLLAGSSGTVAVGLLSSYSLHAVY